MSLKSFVMLAALATSSAFEVSSRVLSAPRAVQRTQARRTARARSHTAGS